MKTMEELGRIVRTCPGCGFWDLVGTAFDLVAVFTIEGLRIRGISPGGRHLLGLADDEPESGLTWFDFLGRGQEEQCIQDMATTLVSVGSWRGDAVLRRRDGTDWPVQILAGSVRRQHTAEHLAVLAAIDRTDLGDMLSTLHHEQMLLRALLDHLPDAVYFKDLQSRFIRVGSAKARKTGGVRPEDLVGKTDFDHFLDDHARAAFEDEQRIIRTGQPLVDLLEKETWADGRVTWVSSTKMPLRDGSGQIIGTFGISRDVSSRMESEKKQRQMETQLALAHKMESVGRLAAGIAHEVNTPTQFINDNTRFLDDAFNHLARVIQAYRQVGLCAATVPACAAAVRDARAAEEAAEIGYLIDEIPRTLQQTLEGIARIARIVRSLKEFSHPGVPEKCPADLNHAIDNAITVSRHEWKYVAEVATDFDPDLPLVPCVLDEFNQVMLNLIVNAAHAIADVVGDSGARGRICVRTRCEGASALIEVEDTGSGIPPEAQTRIFEPFFTTKAVGKGTGQGLSIVHAVIVKRHHGTVDFRTEAGRGTTFQIRLPLAQERDGAGGEPVGSEVAS